MIAGEGTVEGDDGSALRGLRSVLGRSLDWTGPVAGTTDLRATQAARRNFLRLRRLKTTKLVIVSDAEAGSGTAAAGGTVIWKLLPKPCPRKLPGMGGNLAETE